MLNYRTNTIRRYALALEQPETGTRIHGEQSRIHCLGAGHAYGIPGPTGLRRRCCRRGTPAYPYAKAAYTAPANASAHTRRGPPANASTHTRRSPPANASAHTRRGPPANTSTHTRRGPCADVAVCTAWAVQSRRTHSPRLRHHPSLLLALGELNLEDEGRSCPTQGVRPRRGSRTQWAIGQLQRAMASAEVPAVQQPDGSCPHRRSRTQTWVTTLNSWRSSRACVKDQRTPHISSQLRLPVRRKDSQPL